MSGLRDLSVSVLRKLAKEKGLSLAGCIEKSDIVAVLAAAGASSHSHGQQPAQRPTTSAAAAAAEVRAEPSEGEKQLMTKLSRLALEELKTLGRECKVPAQVLAGSRAEQLRDAIIKSPLGIKGVNGVLERASCRQVPKAASAEDDSLSLLSVSELKAFAKGMGVDVSQCLEKAEMIALVTGQQKSPTPRPTTTGTPAPATAASASTTTTGWHVRDTTAASTSAPMPKRERSRSVSDASDVSTPPRKSRRKRATDEAEDRIDELSATQVKALARSLRVKLQATSLDDMTDELLSRADALDILKYVDDVPPPSPPRTRVLESDTPSEGEDETTDGRSCTLDESAAGYDPSERLRLPPHTSTMKRDGGPCLVRAANSVLGRFRQLHLISEGTYGKVWKAYDRTARKVRALKQIKHENAADGFSESAIKEIEKLQLIKNENIVALLEVVVGQGIDSVFLVMEYADHDLAHISSNGHKWTMPQVKLLLADLCRGMQEIHACHVMHRDLKPANLLYTRRGVLKICDFGSARTIAHDSCRNLTPGMCTLWYRAPEILLGGSYNQSSDMWSIGCIFAELLTGASLWSGSDEQHQVKQVFDLLGTPGENDWPDLRSLLGPNATIVVAPSKLDDQLFQSKHRPRDDFEQAFPLLAELLSFAPARRPSAQSVVHNAFLLRGMADRRDMPVFEPCDADVTAKRRKKRKQRNKETLRSIKRYDDYKADRASGRRRR